MSKLITMRNRSLPMLIAPSLAAPAIVHMEAYANGLTNMIPILYRVLDIVSRELVGFIPSVTLNADGAERVAIGQTISWHKSGTFTISDVQEKMTVDTPADRNPGVDTMTIQYAKKVDFGWTGEDERKLSAPGVGMAALMQSDFAQALRVLTNAIEDTIAVEAYTNASRAVGTAGTTPFATDHGITADMRKILDDNGAPPGLRSMIIGTTAGANMRKLSNLFKVNEAGSEMTLRDGELGNLNGFSIKESGAQTMRNGHTKGTGATVTINNAGYAIGATVLTLASAGTGTVKAGDVVTIAGDTTKYVVASGDTDVSNGGTVTLNAPGLLQAIPASNTLMTIGNSFMPNVGFSQDAIRLLARPPSKPSVGDLRIDEYLLTDPRSGITYEVSVWPGQRMVAYQVALAWGTKAIKEENIVLGLG